MPGAFSINPLFKGFDISNFTLILILIPQLSSSLSPSNSKNVPRLFPIFLIFNAKLLFQMDRHLYIIFIEITINIITYTICHESWPNVIIFLYIFFFRFSSLIIQIIIISQHEHDSIVIKIEHRSRGQSFNPHSYVVKQKKQIISHTYEEIEHLCFV